MAPALLTLAQQSSFWLNRVGSQSAAEHDATFYVILYVTSFFFCLVVALMLYFIVKYRRRPGSSQHGAPTHNTPLEIAWTLIPLIVVVVFFVMGFRGYMDFDVPPPSALDRNNTIDVQAQKWSFQFTYPSGGVSDQLVLLKDQPVRLLMRSADVTHALFIPAFRVQRNVIPGRTTEMWFKPTQAGTYDLVCTQYCGNGHSNMVSKVLVLEPVDYNKKLAALANPFKGPGGEPLAFHVVGAKLRTQMGCATCHTIDGSRNTGPSWKGAWKTSHSFAASNVPGFTLAAADSDQKWEAYLRESILDPGAKIVQGYQNQMPPFAGQLSGSPAKEMKLKALVEYIKSLNEPDYKPVFPSLGGTPAPATGATAPASTPATGK